MVNAYIVVVTSGVYGPQTSGMHSRAGLTLTVPIVILLQCGYVILMNMGEKKDICSFACSVFDFAVKAFPGLTICHY